ncbi:DEAD/DEAH box helicase [Azoarcus sp. L1K30]|uniref:DEAD/DEAH box helicase n=1 Tax=Azoarcus sp. L1K30 TaxID=2820277 RepID=UPI002012FCE9|nr:DEAD/DEAH box helicase [Azoarcus sp. L1K30]
MPGEQLKEDQDHGASDHGGTPWRVANGRLLNLRDGVGWVKVSATEVWNAVFGSTSDVHAAQSPADLLPQFTFSRFPAELAIEISGNAPDDIQIRLIGIGANGGQAPLVAHENDQVFIGNVWYPIRMADYAESLATLSAQRITNGAKISVGQLIWLRTRAQSLELGLIDLLQASDPAEVRAPSAMDTAAWGLQADLYPYQKDGVHFLKLIAGQGLGCILGDEMGLGKTIQVITLMLAEKTADRGPSLVISPATLLENWRRELRLFAPSLAVRIHAGPDRAGVASRLTGFDVVVTSYDTALRDEPLLSSVTWNLLALDEAQNIRNPDARRTVAVKSLPRRISLAITGTPVENRLTDLWSLSDFALPRLLGNRDEFERLFADTEAGAAGLAPIVAPILLRRRVRDVARDLPERIDVAQPLSMSRAMAEDYERTRLEALAGHGKSSSLVALQRLRMFCTHPALIGTWRDDPADGMPKYQRLLELLEEIFQQGEKCLIFTSYTGMTDIFRADLPQRFPGCFFSFIDGRVPVPARQQTVDDFSAATTGGALFLNPKAAGVGLNITAANHVIHYNPEWNPALEDQASARAYRRRQQRPVTIHQMFFADSVEELVVGRLALKRGLAEHAATGHEGDATVSEVLQALQISPLSGILE